MVEGRAVDKGGASRACGESGMGVCKAKKGKGKKGKGKKGKGKSKGKTEL